MQEKIALYENTSRLVFIKSECEDYCEVINNFVLPLLKRFDIVDYTQADIFNYAKNRRLLKTAIAKHETDKDQGNQYLKKYIEKEVIEIVQECFADFYKSKEKFEKGNFSLNSICEPYLKADEVGRYCVDLEKLTEDCTRYAEGEELVFWQKMSKATEILNDIFKGQAPTPFQMCHLWREVDGVLEIETRCNVSRWLDLPEVEW